VSDVSRGADVSGQPDPSFVAVLDRAKSFLSQATSIRMHPLRGTHTNDVPVLMASFAIALILEEREHAEAIRKALR
jgi:hypothetical protein